MDKGTILILSHSYTPNVGGVETHLTDLTRHLLSRNIPCHVLTYQPLVTRARGLPREKSGSLTVRRIPWIGMGIFNKLERYPLLQFLYLFPPLFSAALLTVAFNRKDIRLIHGHGMVCAVMSRILKAIYGIPAVISIHAVYGWLYDLSSRGILPRFLRWTLSGNDHVLALAEASRKELIALGIAESKVSTFTYWIDQQVFAPANQQDARKQLGWIDSFTVLFVGRLIEVKGIRLLLEAAESLPAVRFVFAGDGPLAGLLQETANCRTNVIYAGRIDNSRLPSYYQAADVLCVPSQYEEGFGRIILESLSCGCPVIGSRRGGIPEAMDETVGALVEPCAVQLMPAIQRLQSQAGLLNQLRSRCRTFAESRYSTRNAAAIVEAYDRVSGGGVLHQGNRI
jgi:glycosyltransferase involved in cell wall biosynthesis